VVGCTSIGGGARSYGSNPGGSTRVFSPERENSPPQGGSFQTRGEFSHRGLRALLHKFPGPPKGETPHPNGGVFSAISQVWQQFLSPEFSKGPSHKKVGGFLAQPQILFGQGICFGARKHTSPFLGKQLTYPVLISSGYGFLPAALYKDLGCSAPCLSSRCCPGLHLVPFLQEGGVLFGIAL